MKRLALIIAIFPLVLNSACSTRASRPSRQRPAGAAWQEYMEAARRALSEGRESEAREYMKAIREDPETVEVRAAYAPDLAKKVAGSQGVAVGERNLTLKLINPNFAKIGGPAAAGLILKQGNIATDFKLFGFQQVIFSDGQNTWTYNLDQF